MVLPPVVPGIHALPLPEMAWFLAGVGTVEIVA
jgi:hypothetical protein